ncbi:MAG: hypothetical protein JNM76_09160 [Betaproteobacteria bacterium]|nr:hypothetical protein [Betaproteobacteria bacterium]
MNESLPSWASSLNPELFAGVQHGVLENARTVYDSPPRHYHTWSHVLDCLTLFGKLEFEHPRAVMLALLFHDAIYIAGQPDNEARSADLARRHLREGSDLGEEEIERIAAYILATAHHIPQGDDPDLAKILDIDMSILGQPWQRYLIYAEGVRREYCPQAATEFRFNVGRLHFLQKLLKQDRIFHSAELHAALEDAARQNVARKIGVLQQKLGLVGRLIARMI